MGIAQAAGRLNARSRVRSNIARVALMSLLCTAVVVAEGVAADAKVLPVASVGVTTTRPTVGQPIAVVMHFAPHADMGDFGWENFEVATIPVDRADAAGWPLRTDDEGTALQLNRAGFGEYHGSFTVRRAGWYVVFDRSSWFAHRDGLVVNGLSPASYPPPVKVFVARAPSNAVVAATHDNTVEGVGWSWWLLAAALVAVAAISAALVVGRRRSRQFVHV